MVKYSCVICARNEVSKLTETIDSIVCAANRCSHVKIEVIVIDDGSSDHTEDILKNRNDIVFIQNEQSMGISYSRNLGIKRAQGDFIVFLDAHIKIPLEVDFFGILESILIDSSVDGVSGVYGTLNRINDANITRDIVRVLYRKKQEPAFVISYDNFTTVSSCVFCINKQVIGSYYFDEGFRGIAAEDSMLQLFLMRDGIKIVHSPDLRILHDAELSFRGLLTKIISQANGFNRLIANASKHGLYVPHSTFYLDFPVWSFISVIVSLIFFMLGVNWYYLLLMLTVFVMLDFWPLYKLLFHKDTLRNRLYTLVYVLANEGVKIVLWPLSVVRERYSLKNFMYILYFFGVWYIKKISGVLL